MFQKSKPKKQFLILFIQLDLMLNAPDMCNARKEIYLQMDFCLSAVRRLVGMVNVMGWAIQYVN